jgi:two-component system sensor histidine kinase BaeS
VTGPAVATGGPHRRWRRPARWPARRPGLAVRLLAAQLIVIVAGSLTLGLVAVAVAPGSFTGHLDRAGETNPLVRSHAEEAFDSAFGIALAVATGVAVLTALAVSAFVVRRLSTPVAQLARAADALAAGDYHTDLPAARLGPEFDRLTAAFSHMAGRLARTETIRRRLLADLAHEMRTPIATLQAHVDGLDDGVVSPEAGTWRVLRDQVDRLQRLAADLVQLSAAEEHALSLELRPADLAAVAAAAVEAAAPRYQAKPVALLLDAPRPVLASADTGRMQQVLANLLDNALRHTPATGTVRVSTRQEGRDAVVQVVDTGEGLPAAELEAVFDRFHRVDSARARTHGGSGLGLTIARAIVTDHGGTLTATSDGPGTGANFTLRLPGREGPASAR